jgi:hypothetical protein
MKLSKSLNCDQQLRIRHQTPSGWRVLQSLITAGSAADKNEGIALVIGAGIHRVPKNCHSVVCKKRLLLASWDRLLVEAFPTFAKSSCPSLAWELGLQLPQSNRQAQQTHKGEFVKVLRKLEDAERIARKSLGDYENATRVLGSTSVNEIISLNFDLIAEHLIADLYGIDLKRGGAGKSSTTRHRVIGRHRIWHPHGDRELAGSECIGLRQYGLNIAEIEVARKDFKKRENGNGGKKRDLPMDPKTWIDIVLSNHLIFLGTSLGFAEWDIWFALVNRWRNYAKISNKNFEPKTFVLTTKNHHSRLPTQFLRLDAPSYGRGWKRLGDILNRSTTEGEHCST